MGETALKHSIEDYYLEMEENSLEKLEFHEGEIFAMAGCTLFGKNKLKKINKNALFQNRKGHFV